MTVPRLTYFDMRGRAEAIRLLLHATKTQFEDHRIVSPEEWEALRPKLPFERLPTYEASGHLLCESHAILGYLGRTLASSAAADVSGAELDSARYAIAESQEDLWRFNWRESYYEHLESYARSTLRPRLSQLEGWLVRESRGPQWFGTTFSEVDCLAFCYLDEIDAFFPAILAEFPKLSGFHLRVASLPGISNYLDSDARPPVFGMGSMGPKVDPRVAIGPEQLFTNPWTQPIDLAGVQCGQRRLTRACS